MSRRFLLLAGLCLLLGMVTQAFGAETTQAPWITREGAVALLVESRPEWRAKLAEVRAHVPPMPIFSDTDQDEWYIPYLEVAFAEGLIDATDMHREFHPGALLREGEAIALAVRYKGHDDPTYVPKEEPDHPLSIPLHVQAGAKMGLTLPTPLESWNVIRRSAWNDLLRSAGVVSPEAIVVTIPPKETPVPAPDVPLPVTGPLPSLSPVIQTGYKPRETSAPSLRPIPVAVVAPSYVPNPPGARPISSDVSPLPTSADSRPVVTNQFTISIPALGIQNLTVTHPSDVVSQNGLLAPLQRGLGHLFSYPGNGGTVLVYGHSSSYSWDISEYTKIFRQINKLNQGDRIIITYGGTTFTYEVTYKKTVDASDMSAYQAGNGEQLILYTCWPPDDIKQRYLVYAKPV